MFHADVSPCFVDGPMPNNGRFQILDSGRTLRISHVTRADRDVYTCSAESAAGRMQATAELLILSEGKKLSRYMRFPTIWHFDK